MNKTTIELNGLVFYAYHGALEAESELGQRFKVDVSLRLADGLDFKEDNTEVSVDYSRVFSTVESVFTESRFQLIERAAEAIASELLSKFKKIVEVRVRVVKPSAPVPCACDSFAVEVVQCR